MPQVSRPQCGENPIKWWVSFCCITMLLSVYLAVKQEVSDLTARYLSSADATVQEDLRQQTRSRGIATRRTQ